jgi:hypothetical protein
VKLVAALMAGMLGIILFRSLKTGVVHWGSGPAAFTAERSREPVSYWVVIVFQVLFFSLMLGCAIVLPGPTLPE